MLRSSATVAAVPASAFWWQWPWNRIRLPLTRLCPASASLPSAIAVTSSSSGSRVAAATAAARGSDGSSAGYSSRSVSRHEGSAATIGTPRPTSSARRWTIPDAIRLAWSIRPLERLARPQHPASSSRTFHPAARSTVIAARPTDGSVNVVKESARKTRSPAGAGVVGAAWRRNHRDRLSRSNRGSGRAAVTPSQRSAMRRVGHVRAARFDSG